MTAPVTDAPRGTTARLRYLRTSPPKVREVLALIRGQDIDRARSTLRLCDRSVAHEVEKLLDSAVANAEHNDNVPEDELFISRAFADEGPTIKRWRPRARGRGVRIRKRTSHVTIVVARFADDELERRRRRETSAGGTPRRRPGRRRAAPAEDHDHEHEHDHEHDEVDDDEVAEAAPAKKAAKKSTKKTTKKTAKQATKKAADAEKAPAKKTAKKATKKTTTKTTTKTTGAAKSAKKAPAKKATKKDED
jgi:large subunit ribosomal protein L22